MPAICSVWILTLERTHPLQFLVYLVLDCRYYFSNNDPGDQYIKVDVTIFLYIKL